ncbi:MAG: pyridoxamine 5'-phosphate oxidase family protein [Hyphomicrobium sp.]|nr:pyridoxamine 5'-phosphate oxidase family protein [Hyphomicrobium sp.]
MTTPTPPASLPEHDNTPDLTPATARSLPPYYNDLDASLAHAWSLFERGVSDRRSAFHTPAVATIAENGEPAARIMVLRGVERASRTLRFHTDRRSAKIAHLGSASRASILAYDPRAKIQVRLSAAATLHMADDVAQAAWRSSRPQSRLCYEQADTPGRPIAKPLDAPPPDARYALGDDGEANFAVLVLTIDHVEWLYLAIEGHRRASWCWDGTRWSGSWLAP